MSGHESPFVGTLDELADWLGVGRDTVDSWRRRQGCPRKTERGYDVREFVRWRFRQTWPSSPPSDGIEESKAQADRRRAIAAASREELKLERERGSWVPIERARAIATEALVTAARLFEEILDDQAAQAKRLRPSHKDRINERMDATREEFASRLKVVLGRIEAAREDS